ncbi:hypothetical protein [Pedobacter heparinus]|uniref:Uncharacterized protein n=1 Tax=Pedobacter heparinus (strain ATCC 13125 / DSM 2366 / CIP 104194 / JCM 7457 / NBRC 12017 / NCIMB 9290 / NRRL B-14731 / HIM 762-3) TaxID=485917 RepID=C6Y0V6_PEDHD|nr:hypothetical protein [Pedobacter heparinus]ACU04883.1 hypothetical protein Phep_2682 [Pedobacter heparinus DSM 2366]
MKYLVLLFTIYVMALLAWPCCGSETSLSSEHEDLCYESADARQQDKHESPHPCSPFFHCSNYHSFVAAPAVNKILSVLAGEQNTSFPEYKSCPVILFPGDIWQPPQLV